MLLINSTANDFASSSLYIIIRMILGSGFKGINKIGKVLAVWESRRREKLNGKQVNKDILDSALCMMFWRLTGLVVRVGLSGQYLNQSGKMGRLQALWW